MSFIDWAPRDSNQMKERGSQSQLTYQIVSREVRKAEIHEGQVEGGIRLIEILECRPPIARFNY